MSALFMLAELVEQISEAFIKIKNNKNYYSSHKAKRVTAIHSI